MTDVGQKIWGFCHTLRHDGIDYGDYIEQLTYLLFLKMADERAIELPEGADWPTLRAASGTALADAYVDALRTLGRQTGLLGDIYAGAQSRFNNPVNLKRMITLLDEIEWTTLDVDIKAAVFEELLEKAASEGKKGAGQYFTPRLLIQTIARCMKPDPRAHADFTIGDPACGTGGFLVAAYEWLLAQTAGGAQGDVNFWRRVRRRTYHGKELVARPRRLALMNLYLHNLTPDIQLGDSIYEAHSGPRFDVILTNPPFGTRGANQIPDRDDFTIETSNKQLNFVQHVRSILKDGGRAAMVLPDNCLFADQAGEVFDVLMRDCAMHTVLRLPRGTFSPYSPGTKTNVVFFTRGRPTTETWIYDARSNVPAITKKDRPLTTAHFAEFETCYRPDPNGRGSRNASDSAEDRWRRFNIEEIRAHDFKLDGLRWLRDETLDEVDGLPEPEELASDAIAELSSAVEGLNAILALLDDAAGNEAGSLVAGVS